MNKKEKCPAPGCGQEFSLDTRQYYHHLMIHDAKKKMGLPMMAVGENTSAPAPSSFMPDPLKNLLKNFGIHDLNGGRPSILGNGIMAEALKDPKYIKLHLDIYIDTITREVVALESSTK